VQHEGSFYSAEVGADQAIAGARANPRHGSRQGHRSFTLDAVRRGREIVSMLNGGARPDRDYPRLIADIRSGRINVRDR
jgi:hypothetical protein